MDRGAMTLDHGRPYCNLTIAACRRSGQSRKLRLTQPSTRDPRKTSRCTWSWRRLRRQSRCSTRSFPGCAVPRGARRGRRKAERLARSAHGAPKRTTPSLAVFECVSPNSDHSVQVWRARRSTARDPRRAGVTGIPEGGVRPTCFRCIASSQKRGSSPKGRIDFERPSLPARILPVTLLANGTAR